jgi:cytochrome c biogenesis protein CcmG, thiol:disulfide interchange protein DsbE
MKSWWLFILIFAVAAALLAGCQKRGPLEIGDEVPPITLSDINGRPVNLPNDFNGKVILVRFWSIDCGFCDKKILLALEQFKQRYQGRQFIPVAINEGSLAKDDERLKALGKLSYPMLVDEYGSVARHFGVIGLPTTLVIDENGILRDKLTGEASIKEYEKLLTTILNKGVFYESGH